MRTLPLTPAPSDQARKMDANGDTDGALVRRVQQGDLTAFDELVSRHIGRANLTARRLLQNREDAEDLVQEAFLRALDRIELFDPAYEFAPWFLRLLTNLGLNLIQARKRRQTEPTTEELPSKEAGPDVETERSEIRDRVGIAVATLPPRQRMIVSMFEVDGLGTAEIAERLEISQETVRWHLHQARRTLRTLLADLREPKEGKA